MVETRDSHMEDFLAHQLQSTSNTADTFKKGLENTLKQIDDGYRSTMLMYKVSFYTGVILIGLSVLMAFQDGKSLLSIVFGGFGIANILFFFFAKPPKDLQESRSRLAQLQAALFNWFIDVYNWNSYLMRLDKTDQINFDIMKMISDQSIQTTQKTLELIHKYCGDEKQK
jgi:hypothetical protein